jgi:hypothetical protein
MDAALRDQLVAAFGKLAVGIGESLEPAYGAAVARMAIAEFLALDQYLHAKQWAEAKALVRGRMTGEELAAEKEKLTVLTWEMAESNGIAWSAAGAALTAGLRVLMALALGAVAL